MKKKVIRSWKKVFEQDLSYVAYELKDLVTTPAFIMIEGPIGTGKTTFCKVFVGEEETMSPSYSILSEASNTLHADFYRIKSREDIIQLELGMYLEDKSYFIAEWSKQHFYSINLELPEEFHTYLLNISINPTDMSNNSIEEQTEVSSRDFTLFSVIAD